METNEAMAGLMAFGMVVGLLMMAVWLTVTILFILTLQKALNRCAPENRAMSPGQTWLLLIPLFNFVWSFIVVLNMAKSLKAEFDKRNLAIEEAPGKVLGLLACILSIAGIIPYLGTLLGLGGLVCFILYWVKIAGYSKQLA